MPGEVAIQLAFGKPIIVLDRKIQQRTCGVSFVFISRLEDEFTGCVVAKLRTSVRPNDISGHDVERMIGAKATAITPR